MTGQGEARVAFSGGGFLVAEVRSVNNRHLKISSRLGEGLGFIEPLLDSLVRSKVKRGSIQLNVSWQGRPEIEVQQVRPAVLQAYIEQLRSVSRQLDFAPEICWADLLNLPGVMGESSTVDIRSPELSEAILEAVERAIEDLAGMRAREGSLMENELRRQLDQLRKFVQQIEDRAPDVVAEHRLRLKQRVAAAIADATESGSSAPLVQDADLIREVAILSDKTDIREEIVRLCSHFVQFEELLSSTESQGRRLDFLIQEMFREANTIGSKASDALISQLVVELKAVLEQIRELVQNVE
jgi:uncharacterized protein (TIGR00255 family)